MPAALTPADIFSRAADEGERRLDQSFHELAATGFVAGFTIVFGIIALGIVDGLARPSMGDLAKVPSALAFATGLVLLVVGRAELFSENFFDPVAAALLRRGTGAPLRLLRLWGLTFVLNLVGGALLVLVVTVDGAMPTAALESLSRLAEEVGQRAKSATLARSIVGGALVALLSYLLIAAEFATARILCAFAVGFLLAVGPFDHGVVTALHLAFGLVSGTLTWAQALATTSVTVVGNLVGGVGLVTLSLTARSRG